ncbi:MAG: putative toxin-antitoxin system toxin component, PIN family [Spiribacter salinus]|uniref:Putative toxin-antitoxin system toxin component, PIN family n=1 Tax=Spiribacter salinus TaxID=1335746 RepID=A0A540VQD1_9GAMM|nr:MAG: putative toxin-antitoxin system toxin component, PIN family [Spiribacter salinus]
MTSLKVVLDTNVFVSGLAYPSSTPGKILMAWRSGALEVCASRYVLDELRQVLPRLVRRHGLSDQEMDDFVDILSFQVELVQPAGIHDEDLGDGCDQAVLGTLVAGMAQHEVTCLVTGDKDLLALEGRYPIVTPAFFWQRHGPV